MADEVSDMPGPPPSSWSAGATGQPSVGPVADPTVPPPTHAPGPPSSPASAAEEAGFRAAAAVRVRRGPAWLSAIGVLLLLFAIVGWWAQDAVAPFVNEGEADMRSTVTFVATADRYRVITSGPLRPELDRTGCDIVLADGSTVRRLGGEGSVVARERLGVTRALEFDAVAGTTTVRCEDRIAGGQGRFQVVSTAGPASLAVTGAGIGGVVFLLLGLVWGFLGRR